MPGPPFPLIRQLSRQDALYCFCSDPLGFKLGDPRDLRLGCGDAVHYHCLLQYLRSKIGDRATMDLRGIACPYGGDCRSHQAEHTPGRSNIFYVTIEDLDNIVDYRTPERAEALDALLRESGTEPLTHGEVGELRIWLERRDFLQALREILGDSSINEIEKNELVRLGEAREPLFCSLVRQRGTLPHQMIDELRAHLVAFRASLPSEKLDPYVEATTKACPTCTIRSSHWHSHQCHHISPATNGCPNCHVHYCYRCRSTEVENKAKRGERNRCACNFWSNFCKPIRDSADVEQFFKFNRGLPFDVRCGCVICPSCREDEPCAECPGDCPVCTGLLNPCPLMLGQAWVLRKAGDSAGATAKLSQTRVIRLFDACRHGDERGLAGVLVEAAEIEVSDADASIAYMAALVNTRDREGRSALLIAVDAAHTKIVCILCKVPGLEVNASDRGGWTALICAASRGQLEAVKILLATPGIEANARDHSGCSALVWAAREGQGAVVQALLAARDIDVNLKSDGGRSALFWAAASGGSRNFVETIRLLLAAAPTLDVEARDSYGASALDMARNDVVRGLIGAAGESGGGGANRRGKRD